LPESTQTSSQTTNGQSPNGSGKPFLLGLTGYQWAVLFAAWLGWGFDVFDGLLFSYAAPKCVPNLFHLSTTDPHTRAVVLWWTGFATSVLLVGWGLGGVLFGRIADRIGRSRTLLLTILLYGVGTAACALAPSMSFLLVFRFVSALGIGGEWAAGSSLVAEVVPEKRRVEAGALLYTSATAGLYLATIVNKYFSTGQWLTDETSWRYVMACGLIPVVFAFVVRLMVKEPTRWKSVADRAARARIRDLFTPENRRITLSGFIPALISLLAWWSCNALIQVIAANLAGGFAAAHGYPKPVAKQLAQNWIEIASNVFNIGGLIGTLLTVPIAKAFGRRIMYIIYFALSGGALLAAFGLHWTPYQQLLMYFPIGLTVFGVFGSFTFYLPELFPTKLRATGSGFCYNIGRLIAAIGPFAVVSIAQQGADAIVAAKHALFYVGFLPLIGLLFMPLVIETKGRELTD
jgi:MFS family permease